MGIAFGLAPWAYGALKAARNHFAATLLLLSPVHAEPVTVAALGDSLTQGYGLAFEDGLVTQLQDWLDSQGAEVRVLNAGVSGDTTAGGRARVGWTLTPEVDALIVALGGNDVLRGIDPAVSRENLQGILDAARAAQVPVLLVGIAAPGNYGADYKSAFEAIFPELAAQYGALLLPDLMAPVSERIAEGAALSDVAQADGLHPNAEGVRLIVEALGPMVLELAALAAP